MILAIDAGNSRTKWGVFDAGGKLIAQGALDNSELQSLAQPLPAWRDCQSVVISNVAGPALGEKIGALLLPLAIPMRTITAQPASCGVTNTYVNPEQLGSDRWAALIAAWNQYRQPCIVATAGTALTVDALSGSGEFLGGMILPGIGLMQQSLLDSTAGIRESMGEWQDFPTSTANALYTAALTAAAGNVKGMAARLQRHSRAEPLVVVGGGDAKLLAECLLERIVMTNKLVIADNLVLQGLLLIENELGTP